MRHVRQLHRVGNQKRRGRHGQRGLYTDESAEVYFFVMGQSGDDAIQLAAVWQMADRAQRKPIYLPLTLK